MSAPIIDAANVAAMIDAFRFANAPRPSVRPEQVAPSSRAGGPGPAWTGSAEGSPIRPVAPASIVQVGAAATVAATRAGLYQDLGAATVRADPAVAQFVAAPNAPEIEAAVRAMARTLLDQTYLNASGGVRLAAALLALEPTAQVFAALDRRILFAIATDLAGAFSPIERKGARAWLERLASAILSGLKDAPPPGTRDMILKGFIQFLDAAGPEEKRSVEWVVQRAAAQFGRERLAAMESRILPNDPGPPNEMVDVIKAALARPAAGFQPIADATALVATLRDMPLLATAFLTPEMLLVGLAAFQRAGVWRVRDPRLKPGAARRPQPDSEALLILPLERDWESVPDAGPLIEAWQSAAGRTLPDDYLGFLESHNGGRVYPNMFDYSVPLTGVSTTGATTFLDRLYAWGTVEEVWRGGRFAGCLPPDMLAIGCDPGGMEILLSLRPADFGAISCWPHSTEPWGARTNRDVYPLAGSFEAFVTRLRDVPDGAGHRYWDRPALRRLARRLEIW